MQWLRNGFAMGWNRHLPTFPRHQMVGSNADGEYNLQISSVTLDDESTFVCQLGASSDQPAISSQPAKLTVLVPPQQPKFRSHGDVIGAVVGQQEIITCQSSGGKPAPELEWVLANDSEGRSVVRRIPADRTNAEANGKVFDVWSQIRFNFCLFRMKLENRLQKFNEFEIFCFLKCKIFGCKNCFAILPNLEFFNLP